MANSKNEFLHPSHFERYLPQEEMLETKKKRSKLIIGLPKETSAFENRICLVPDAVGLLVQNDHTILIESNAGKEANFSDIEYSDAGGKIVKNRDEIFQADIIIKVSPLSLNEISSLKSRQTIFSKLEMPNQKKEYFKRLAEKKTTTIASEFIKDQSGTFPVVQSISEIAGNYSIIIASDYLSNPKFGQGILLGGVPGINPAEVVILGAGTAGENAARAALGLGAFVKVFDISISKLRKLQTKLNNKIYTSVFQPGILRKSLKTADVVIGAIRANEGKSPNIVSEEMVKEMKAGSIIIDLSIDHGGCFETSELRTHKDPVFIKHNVTHYCVPNICSRIPQTSSIALSNFLTPMLIKIGEEGGVDNLIRKDFGLRNGVYLYNGKIVKQFISDQFGLPFQNIDLLFDALPG